MSNSIQTNLPVLSVEKTINLLSKAYCSVIQSGIGPKALPSVMLWGAPGIGKSQAVRQLAEEIQAQTGKQVNVTDVRLLLFNPIDLRGIPTANAKKTLAIWLKPQIFQMDDSIDVVNILFLDEISAAPQSVQAAAYQITLDRVVGEHQLPDNCIVIAAGNRVTDKSVAYKMPKALANRLLHIEIEGSFAAWSRWAIKAGIHEKVLGFLSFQNHSLFGFDATNDDLAFATPRSWEMVSNLLNKVDGDPDAIYPLIAGLVGSGIAIEFRTWCHSYEGLPAIEEVFNGTVKTVPKQTDALYAIVSSMTAYAREHRDDMTQIANSISYAKRFPADFSMLLMKNYAAMEKDYVKKLMNIPAYLEWASGKGALLNGLTKS